MRQVESAILAPPGQPFEATCDQPLQAISEVIPAEELATIDPVLLKVINLRNLFDEAIARHHSGRNAYVSHDGKVHGFIRGTPLAQKAREHILTDDGGEAIEASGALVDGRLDQSWRCPGLALRGSSRRLCSTREVEVGLRGHTIASAVTAQSNVLRSRL